MDTLTMPTRRDLVPMSPAFPAAWSPDVALAAYAHAVEAYPNEAAGIAVNGTYARLDNVSQSPERDVVLGPMNSSAPPAPTCSFTTLPMAWACRAEGHDLSATRHPFVVMVLPVCASAGDTLAPPLRRGFRHGVHDCYAVMPLVCRRQQPIPMAARRVVDGRQQNPTSTTSRPSVSAHRPSEPPRPATWRAVQVPLTCRCLARSIS
jgi:hypothetical protein